MTLELLVAQRGKREETGKGKEKNRSIELSFNTEIVNTFQ